MCDCVLMEHESSGEGLSCKFVHVCESFIFAESDCHLYQNLEADKQLPLVCTDIAMLHLYQNLEAD